ncbi:hypothetical protein, partial [Micromonospora aurantiaca (nom. illeg.)]|uniref:hypothetical protein n=1 Tax=Micromonospora aurantiaca (nom. illeg.) TaxID=47850 RepID=UPI003F49FDC2
MINIGGGVITGIARLLLIYAILRLAARESTLAGLSPRRCWHHLIAITRPFDHMHRWSRWQRRRQCRARKPITSENSDFTRCGSPAGQASAD